MGPINHPITATGTKMIEVPMQYAIRLISISVPEGYHCMSTG